MAGNPPELRITLLETKNLKLKSKPWDDIKIPIDILLLTVKDCEFLSCLSHLNRDLFRGYRQDLGWVYFGDVVEDEENKLKIAVIKCSEGAAAPGGAIVSVKNAVAVLRPKAVINVGYCASLRRGEAKLGDVVVSASLRTYGPSRVTDNGIEELGHRVPPKSNFLKVIHSIKDGWVAPLQNPKELDVEVHRDGEFLSGPEKVQSQERCKQLIQRFPQSVAIETEGAGLFAAAHDLDIEWVIIKGISEYADGSCPQSEPWRRFASAMAASVTAKMLSETIVFQAWPHYKDTVTQHQPIQQTKIALPFNNNATDQCTQHQPLEQTKKAVASNNNATVKAGIPSNDDLEELSLSLGDKWNALGRRLGFEGAKITAFHKENEKLSEKAFAMLMEWKQTKASSATYRVLYDALCHRFVNCTLIAEEICCGYP